MIAYIIMMPHWQSRVCKEVLRVSQTDRWSDILGRAFTSAQLKTSYNKANPRQQYSYYDDYEDPQSAEETRDSELTEEELEDRTTFLNECCMVANCIQDVADGCRGLQPPFKRLAFCMDCVDRKSKTPTRPVGYKRCHSRYKESCMAEENRAKRRMARAPQ